MVNGHQIVSEKGFECPAELLLLTDQRMIIKHMRLEYSLLSNRVQHLFCFHPPPPLQICLNPPRPPFLHPTNAFLKLPPSWVLVTALSRFFPCLFNGSPFPSLHILHLIFASTMPPLSRGSLKFNPTLLYVHSYPSYRITSDNDFNHHSNLFLF